MKKHKTKILHIGGIDCDIDIGIYPVIIWLNSFSGVETQYCCQGYNRKSGSNNSYVALFCYNKRDLDTICETFEQFYQKDKDNNEISVDYGSVLNVPNSIMYCFRWKSFKILKEFIKFLKEKPKEGEITSKYTEEHMTDWQRRMNKEK